MTPDRPDFDVRPEPMSPAVALLWIAYAAGIATIAVWAAVNVAPDALYWLAQRALGLGVVVAGWVS